MRTVIAIPEIPSEAKLKCSAPVTLPDRDLGGQEGGEDLDTDLVADTGMRSNAQPSLQLPIFPPAPSEFERWAPVLARHPDLQPELFGLGHGVANWVDRSNAAGNGVVSLAAAYAWRTLKAAHLNV